MPRNDPRKYAVFTFGAFWVQHDMFLLGEANICRSEFAFLAISSIPLQVDSIGVRGSVPVQPWHEKESRSHELSVKHQIISKELGECPVQPWHEQTASVKSRLVGCASLVAEVNASMVPVSLPSGSR